MQFLKRIDAEVPADLDIHIVLDNYSTHKTPAVVRWLVAHPRFYLHFTPTYASWLNLVEGWFAALTTSQLRRGIYRSVVAVEFAAKRVIAAWMTSGDARWRSRGSSRRRRAVAGRKVDLERSRSEVRRRPGGAARTP